MSPKWKSKNNKIILSKNFVFAVTVKWVAFVLKDLINEVLNGCDSFELFPLI